MANSTIQKFIANLSKNKNVQNLVQNLNDLASELKEKNQDLNIKINKQTEARVQLVLAKYQDILAQINTSEKKLEGEVNTAIKKIKAAAAQVEKNLAQYKKKAQTQKVAIEKIIFKKGTTKKAAPKKTTKMTTKKATTKKVATKKTTSKKSTTAKQAE